MLHISELVKQIRNNNFIEEHNKEDHEQYNSKSFKGHTRLMLLFPLLNILDNNVGFFIGDNCEDDSENSKK